jgi:hypothetical protein
MAPTHRYFHTLGRRMLLMPMVESVPLNTISALEGTERGRGFGLHRELELPGIAEAVLEIALHGSTGNAI